MAFDPNQQDPNQQNQQNQTSDQIPTTSSAPGAGPAPAGAGKGTAPQATPAQPFQNLQAYLGANAPQVTDQANKIAGNLNNQYGQVKSAIDQGQTDFGKQVNGGYVQNNPNLVDQAASHPTDFVSNPDNVKAFQSLYNDTYTGPTNYESTGSYGDMSANVNKAMSDASLLGTNAGVQTYFQNQNPNATKGGSILDSVLLQGTPEAYSAIQNAAKPFANLNDYLNNATTVSDKNASDAAANAHQVATDAQNRFTGSGGVIPNFEKDFSDRLATGRTDAKKQAQDAVALLKNLPGEVDANTLKELGLTQDQFNALKSNQDILRSYNALTDPATGKPYSPGALDLTNYAPIQDPTVGIAPAQFASANDYSMTDALQKLTGQDLTSFLNPANADKAGTAPSLVQFNNQKAKEGTDTAVKQNDHAIISQIMGTGTPEDPNTWSGGKSYWNNIATGKLQPNPNPAIAARQMQALNAAIRQGWFVPTT